MPRFRLSSHVTVSAYTVIDADTVDAAIAQAKDRDVVIGGRHTGAREAEAWVIDDADGAATNITVES